LAIPRSRVRALTVTVSWFAAGEGAAFAGGSDLGDTVVASGFPAGKGEEGDTAPKFRSVERSCINLTSLGHDSSTSSTLASAPLRSPLACISRACETQSLRIS